MLYPFQYTVSKITRTFVNGPRNLYKNKAYTLKLKKRLTYATLPVRVPLEDGVRTIADQAVKLQVALLFALATVSLEILLS